MNSLHDESVRATVFVAIGDSDLQPSVASAIQATGFRARYFNSGQELISAVSGDEPGCLIFNTRLPDGDGFVVFDQLKQLRRYCAPAIFVSSHTDVPTAVAAMKQPGVGYFFVKPLPHELMVEQIRSAVRSDHEAREQLARRQKSAAALSKLSPREREVLDGLLQGKPNKQIAAEFSVSVKTVATHRANILEKLNVGSLVALVHAVDAA